jgi:Cu+-exporting ATPase
MSSLSSGSSSKPAYACCAGQACDDLDLKHSRAWLRIAIAGVFAGQGMVLSLALNMTPPPFASMAYWILHGGLILSALTVMAFLGVPLFASTLAMFRGRRLSIEGLFTLSLLGAFVGSVVSSITGQGSVYYEVVSIVIAIYTFGRMLSERSQAKMKLESARLRERFDGVTVQSEEGDWQECSLAEVSVGALVRVEPGGPFTVDGIIQTGVGYVQETALTGEPLPVVRRAGDRVRAGAWAVDSRFELVVEQGAGTRELDVILETVEDADGRPSELQTQANDLIRIFLPIVVAVSAATALFWGLTGTWMDAVLNSMAVLLVACPCALGLATPVAISQGLFRLAQFGLVSRDGALIDALARTRCVFFDKTGTLSESDLRVTELWVDTDLPIKRNELLASILAAESGLEHPVARALTKYLKSEGIDEACELRNLQVIAGQGIAYYLVADELKHRFQVGEASLAESEQAIVAVAKALHEKKGRRVFVYLDDRVVACLVLGERLRVGVDQIWVDLDALEIRSHILTGDPLPELTLPPGVQIEKGLSSADKVERVRESIEAGESPLFVGDGINDVAAMLQASGSIAMHSGAGLARSVAMGQLSDDQIELIPKAVSFSRAILRKLRGNLLYAFVYNLIGMALAAAGLLHPVAAALIMLVSSFWVTARALSGHSRT